MINNKHIDLEIAYEPDPGGGWRMEDRNANGNDRFKNPKVKRPDTIRWLAPREHEVSIVILGASPFERNGTRIAHEIIDIEKGGKSEKFDIAEVPDGTYEYGALVKEGEGDYTYVRGEHSPPGVVVGGGGSCDDEEDPPAP